MSEIIKIKLKKNGRLDSKGHSSEGKLNGPHENYYSNGIKVSEGNYKNGERHGEIKFFDEEGKIKQNDLYDNGKKLND